MLYTSYLKEQEGRCIFCQYPDAYTIYQGKYFAVIPAKARYAPDHLLIISKRHVYNFTDLTNVEHVELVTLIQQTSALLYDMKYSSLSLFVREGKQGDTSGKSVSHFHYHILPDQDVRGISLHIETRMLLDDAAHQKIAQSLQHKWDALHGIHTGPTA